MNLELKKILPNTNNQEKNTKNEIKFQSNKSNLDVYQSIELKDKYNKLVNETKYDKINNNYYKSIYDNINNLECINNNCSEYKNKTMDTKKQNLVKKNKLTSNIINKNLDILVSLIYIFLLVIFLLGSIIKKNVNYLINILIITLIYLFYKIFISY